MLWHVMFSCTSALHASSRVAIMPAYSYTYSWWLATLIIEYMLYHRPTGYAPTNELQGEILTCRLILSVTHHDICDPTLSSIAL